MTIKHKHQLAEMYCISRKALNNYLNTGQLFQQLSKIGYYKYNKLLTPRQLSLIFDFLGEPN